MELLVLGLDGLSYNMLERFDVETPFLDSVRVSGVSGDLMSVDTPTTLPAWTSFATGLDPGSHGLSNMIRQEPDYTVSSGRPNTTDPAVYDFIGDGLFVNLPASAGRAPSAENTLLVSAMASEDKADAVPDELKYLDAYEDYVLNHDPSLKVRPQKYLEHVIEITEARKEFALQAFDRCEPRVGYLLFSTPDWAGHILSNLSGPEEREQFYSTLLERVDEAAAAVAERADNVLVMSDHGFEYKHSNVHVAEWLRERGYLIETTGDTDVTDVVVRVAKEAASRSDRLYGLIRKVHNHIMGTAVGESLTDAAKPDVAYEESTAWQHRYATIVINDDRFHHPTVDDPDALKRGIRDGLAATTDEDGNPVFRDVLLAEEAYEDPGPDAPDVIARPTRGRFPTTLLSPTGELTSPTENFEHRYRGIVVADGPLFSTGEVEEMSIVDVLPTVLAALDEPVSPEFDGEARLDVLSDPAEPETLAPADVPDARTTDDDVSAAERDEATKQRLADLGYIE